MFEDLRSWIEKRLKLESNLIIFPLSSSTIILTESKTSV